MTGLNIAANRAEKYAASKVRIENYLRKISKKSLIKDIVIGLKSIPKRISSVYFYDQKGSKLFEKITKLPEYYLTRSEKSIIPKIAQSLAYDWEGGTIVELGNGDPSKIMLLLQEFSQKQLAKTLYVPVDVSESAIRESIAFLSKRFPFLEINGLIADFMKHLNFIPRKERHIFCFFGSTIGNLSREDAKSFVRNISMNMSKGDLFLIGLDRVKDLATVEAAYNDMAGITEAFNKNCLSVINGIIDSNFNTDDFRHVAFYNREKQRIEMHLEACFDIEICSPEFAAPLVIKKGERIHTENSHKFNDDHIRELQKCGNFQIRECIEDKLGWFSIVLFEKQ